MPAAECPFCAIINGDDPNAKVVFRDGNVTALFPLAPATRGHTLVVPNRHVAELTDLTEMESRQLGAAVRRTARGVRAAVSPEGLNIIQSTGEAATQTVPHVHFHVLPRWDGDAMTLTWPTAAAENDDAQEVTLAEVRGVLPAYGENVSPEDRRQHLSFIQAIVTRMSQASSSAKTWLLPVVTLAYGYALQEKQFWPAILGVAAVLIFGVLDANYLKQERAFRNLYDTVAAGGDIPVFSLNPAMAGPAGSKVNYWPDWEDIGSWAVAPIYGPLLFSGLAIATWVHCT
jgi:histidine triad (HIT) family protein